MSHMCAFAKFFLYFTNLYPSISQSSLQQELTTCFKQCLDSGSCFSVFYDKTKRECLLMEVLMLQTDSGLVGRVGAVYYAMDTTSLQIECASSPGYHLEETGLCLKQGTSTETWSAAKTLCENDGASLVKIGSQWKDNALKSMLSTEWTWAGGNDIATEGTYVWTDGSPVQGFTDWQGNEPDGGTTQNCMEITASGWYNGGCGVSKKYMCEKKILP